MPARVIRAEINASDSLAQVSIGADLMFRALIVAVDDYGRTDGRLRALKAALFPMRDEVSTEQIAEWLEELTSIPGAPVLFYEVDGRPYLWLTGWEEHRGRSNRAKGSKFPSPPKEKKTPEAQHESVPDIRENPSDPPEGMESRVEGMESRVEGMESRVGGDVPADAGNPGASRAGPSRRVLTDKPESFPDESRERLRQWAVRKGFDRSVLNAGLDLFRDWEPQKPPYRRTIEQWEGSFKKITREGVADGTIPRTGDAVKPKGQAYADADEMLARRRREYEAEVARSEPEDPEAIGRVIDMSLRAANGEA